MSIRTLAIYKLLNKKNYLYLQIICEISENYRCEWEEIICSSKNVKFLLTFAISIE